MLFSSTYVYGQEYSAKTLYLRSNEICSIRDMAKTISNMMLFNNEISHPDWLEINKRNQQNTFYNLVDVALHNREQGVIQQFVYTIRKGSSKAEVCQEIAQKASLYWPNGVAPSASSVTAQRWRSTSPTQTPPTISNTTQTTSHTANTVNSWRNPSTPAPSTNRISAPQTSDVLQPNMPIPNTFRQIGDDTTQKIQILFNCLVLNVGKTSIQNECDELRNTFSRINTFIPELTLSKNSLETDLFITIAPEVETSIIKYDLRIIGQKEFGGKNSNTTITVSKDATTTAKSEAIFQNTKRLLMESGIITEVSLPNLNNAQTTSITEARNTAPTTKNKIKDWLIMSTINGSISLTENSKNGNFINSLTANKTKGKDRLDIGLQLGYNLSSFTFLTSEGPRTSTNKYLDWNATTLRSKALNSQWAMGGILGTIRMASQNVAGSFIAMPGFEYSIFPVTEGVTKQLAIRSLLGMFHYSYIDSTYLDRKKETLLAGEIALIGNFYERWGSANLTLKASRFFNKISDSSINFNGNINLRINQKLSFNFSVYGFLQSSIKRYSKNFYLDGITPEDILLGRAKLPSNFSLGGSVGLTFNFGSNYINPINQRFGNSQIFL